MAANANLIGVAALTKQLIALGKLDDGKALRRAVKAGIKPAYERAYATIPVGNELHRVGISKRSLKKLRDRGIRGLTVGPGFAKSALRTITTINAEKNIASGLLSVRKAAYYVLQFVELGTRHQRAQPFLRRAFSDARSDMEAALRESLRKDLEKAVKG